LNCHQRVWKLPSALVGKIISRRAKKEWKQSAIDQANAVWKVIRFCQHTILMGRKDHCQGQSHQVTQKYHLPIVWKLIWSNPQLSLARTVKIGQLWMD
jgi:hypothetical protein